MAMKSAESKTWKAAKAKEIQNMIDHNVWILRLWAPDDTPIASTWTYRKKLGSNNQVVEYKAQICAQGF
jgi:hypothetical protein